MWVLGLIGETFFLHWLKLGRSEPYVFWEDIPRRRPNQGGEAWERYHQRMRERSNDQRERVVSALLAYKILQMHLNYICMLGVLLLLSCFLENRDEHELLEENSICMDLLTQANVSMKQPRSYMVASNISSSTFLFPLRTLSRRKLRYDNIKNHLTSSFRYIRHISFFLFAYWFVSTNSKPTVVISVGTHTAHARCIWKGEI